MGRNEGSIKADHEAVAELAQRLRELRADAGRPTYRAMAAHTHYSASTLSRAAAGGSLPSLDVVLAYAAACGGDRAEWTRRWQQANTALQPRPEVCNAVPPPRGAPPQPRPLAGRHWSGGARMAVPLAAVLLAAALLTATGLLVVRGAQGKPQGRPVTTPSVPALARISDGDDPRADGCAAVGDAEAAALGAREVAVRTIRAHSGTVIGWLALWRNARCGAEWAEASYVDPHLYPVTLEAHRSADGATVVDHVVVNLPRDPVIGQLLTTAPGCIWARMTLTIPHSAPLIVQTPCV